MNVLPLDLKHFKYLPAPTKAKPLVPAGMAMNPRPMPCGMVGSSDGSKSFRLSLGPFQYGTWRGCYCYTYSSAVVQTQVH